MRDEKRGVKMKKKESLIHHYAVLIVLAIVTVLSISLLIIGSAAGVGDTFSSANGTYEYLAKDDTNVGPDTYSYGTANLVVFKQGTAFVVWVDSSIPLSEDAFILASVRELDKSLDKLDGVVTRSTDFWMNTLLTTTDSQYEVHITVDISAKTFTILPDKGISHYSLFKFKPYTAELTVDKDVTGTNASAAEDFSITVTFTGSNIGGITNNSSLPIASNGIYTLMLSGSDTPVKFSNIPYGTSYTVTESITGAQATAGWSYTSGAVIVPVVLSSADTSDLITILNTFSQTASLVVDKDVLGTNAPTDEAFSINVTFTGTNLGGITNSAGPNVPSGVYNFMLSGSDTSVTFSNIPYGTFYTVTETVSGAQTAAGWAKADSSGEVTAAVELNANNTSDTVTITNDYTEPTATLVIDKTVTGENASTSEPFSITVTFIGNFGGITNNASLPVAIDGIYTFQLSGSGTPVTFSNIPYGTQYTVTEAIGVVQTDWTNSSGTVEQNVTLSSANPTDTVVLINNYGPTASLIVDKTVNEGASTSEAFSITVTFTGDNLGDIETTANGTGGVYTFPLSADGSPVTFSNIPYGTKYTVTEVVSALQVDLGWSDTASGQVLAMTTLDIENTSDTIAIVNTFTPTAALFIDKSVDGINPSSSEEFSITVTFSGEVPLNGIKYSGGANNPTGVYTFNLSAGAAPVEFSKIPYGTSYTVTEAVTSQQAALGWANTSGQITQQVVLSSNNIDDTVALVNTFTPTAMLVIDKSVFGTNASTSEEFIITVTFTGSNTGSIANNVENLNGTNGVYTFPLSASDQQVVFSYITYGTTYTVTEAISGGQALAGWTNTTGTVTQPVQLDIENPSDTLNIVNNYGPTASLVIDKNVLGTNASASEEFSITVTFTNESLESLSDITNNAGPNVPSGVYTLMLSGSDDQVFFSNIPYNTQYTVNETISDAQANLGWAYSSGKVTEPVALDSEHTSDVVAIVNNYTPQTPPPSPPVIENGSLTVAKNISGIGAPTTEEFAITVEFTGSFGGIANNAGLIGTGGVYTLSLVDGESVTFSNIPAGIIYTVTESLTEVQIANGWTGPSALSGTINSTVLVDVSVVNAYNGTGVAGDNDIGDVAGDTDSLPQTGGISLSTLLGIMGLTLAASGGIVVFVFRKHRYSKSN